METSISSKNAFLEGQDFYITLPFRLLSYFSKEYVLQKKGRFTKFEAFEFLVIRYVQGKASSSHSQAVSIKNLVKEWMWNRWTVSKFIGLLSREGVVDTQMVGTEKFVSVKPSILQWVDCSQNNAQRLRGDSLPSQPSSSQSSSSERREELSSGEKSLEV